MMSADRQPSSCSSASASCWCSPRLVGWLLARARPAVPRAPVIENLNARIKAWWVMVAVIGVAFLFGRTGVIVLFASDLLLRAARIPDPGRDARGDHYALAAPFFVVLPVQYCLIWIDWYGLYAIFIPVYAFLLLPIIAVLRGDTKRFLERIAEMQWGLMICVFCLSHVPALLTLRHPGLRGAQPPADRLPRDRRADAATCCNTSGASSSAAARSRPSSRPRRPGRGLIGGVRQRHACSARRCGGSRPSRRWQAGADGARRSRLMGFFGGLVMSAIKRDRGVKDWGRMIEGHGGMLDRLDSVIFAAPIFFHLVRYGWAL